jgi:ERCC4-type nuclease
MLLVDYREGSKDLLKPLLAAGLPAEIANLDSGDLAFQGKGVKGVPLAVGIELKRLDANSTDLTQSLQSGRLSGEQLPKMLGKDGAYDYAWLLIEGSWRHDEAGHITVYQGPKRGWTPIRGGITAAELEKRVLTLELCGGLHVRHTSSRRDSVRFIAALYHWWVDTSLDAHQSHLAVHEPNSLIHISDFRRAVSAWPGIGLKTSKAVEGCFRGSVRRAASASESDWAELDIDGKRFGTARAKKLVAFLNG